MPRVNFPTIGDIEDYEFLRGTIKTIDSATDTCTVEVAEFGVISALLFYHCLPDSQLRENGALEGSAAGFAEDDSVIVQLKYDKSVARVVAHVDGVRKCGGWSFRIVRADGQIVTPDWYTIDIEIYNSTHQWVGNLSVYYWSRVYEGSDDGFYVNGEDLDLDGNPWTIDKIYDPAKKEWFFSLPAGTEDVDGYYLAITCKQSSSSSSEVGVTTYNDGEARYSLRWSGARMPEGRYDYLIHYFDQVNGGSGFPASYDFIPYFASMTPAEKLAAVSGKAG